MSREFVVVKWSPLNHSRVFIANVGGWTTELTEAKTWKRVAFADRESFKHPGAVVVPKENVGGKKAAAVS